MKSTRLDRTLRWGLVASVAMCCGCPVSNFVLLSHSSVLIVSQDPLPVTFRVRTGTPSLDNFRRELVINVPRGNNSVEVPLFTINDLSYCGVNAIPYTNMSRYVRFKQVDSEGKELKNTQAPYINIGSKEVGPGLYEVTVSRFEADGL